MLTLNFALLLLNLMLLALNVASLVPNLMLLISNFASQLLNLRRLTLTFASLVLNLMHLALGSVLLLHPSRISSVLAHPKSHFQCIDVPQVAIQVVCFPSRIYNVLFRPQGLSY